MKRLLIILSIILLIACSEKTNNPFITIDGVSAEAEKYINSAIDTMQQYSISKYEIDWTTIREETFDQIFYAQNTSDTYAAIRFALAEIDRIPGVLIEPSSAMLLKSTSIKQFEPVTIPSDTKNSIYGTRLSDEIAYIRTPYFTESGEVVANYTEVIKNQIKLIDAESVKAWIVDLRQAYGGNIWNMIAGVGPILGNGLAGKFIDADNIAYEWSYENGKLLLDDYIIYEYEQPYDLYNQNPYVAVLTDSMTTSGSEAMVVSFKGRDKTRSFGNSTYGYSLLRGGFILSDGARIYFTTHVMADRNNNRYGNRVAPDQRIIGDFKEIPTNNDVVVNAAVEWLESNL
jgi:hypothetical protein